MPADKQLWVETIRGATPRLVAIVLAASATGTVAAPLAAQTNRASGVVSVSATVTPECRLDVTPLNFGVYNPVESNARTPADADAEFRLSCTPGTAVRIIVGMGQTAGNGQRRMSAGAADRLPYEIYRDAGRTIPWSNGHAVTLTTSQQIQQIPVYGRIPAGQDVSVGAYADSVVVTIVF